MYKIRLNEDDAKRMFARRAAWKEKNGDEGKSIIDLDSWNEAVENTKQEILNSVPHPIRKAMEAIRPALPKKREDSRCERCNGKGTREDREHWLRCPGGKVCFACEGSGIAQHMEPWWVRRRAYDAILAALEAKDRAKVVRWAQRVLDDSSNPYRGVLIDLAEVILRGGNVVKLPA